MVKNLPAVQETGSIPGSGRSPGKGNGNPLQYSCLENPMDRGPGGLQSIGLQRAGHHWVTDTFTSLQSLYTSICKLTLTYISLYIHANLCECSLRFCVLHLVLWSFASKFLYVKEMFVLTDKLSFWCSRQPLWLFPFGASLLPAEVEGCPQ